MLQHFYVCVGGPKFCKIIFQGNKMLKKNPYVYFMVIKRKNNSCKMNENL